MHRLSDKVCSYEAGYGDGDFHHERYGSLLPVDGQKGRGHSSKSHTYQLDSDDEGSSRSSGLRSTLLGHVEYENHDQSVISSKKGKVRGSAGSKALPPYQTMMIKVLTQCEECVRKVKKAVAHAEGVESINVDMDLKKITIRGHLDPQKVMKKASKTGKSVEFLSCKGSTIKSAPMYDQQEAKGGNFSLKHDFPRSPSDINIYGMDGFPKSTGDQKTYKKGLENNYQQILRGVSRLNLTPEDKPTNNDMKISATKKNAMEYKHGINVNAPNTKEKLQHDHHQQNSEVMPHGHSIESDHHPRHPLLDQESSYFQSSGGKKLKLKQKQQDHDKHISSEFSKQSFTYPASRDEGSYIFSDENPNNCCVM